MRSVTHYSLVCNGVTGWAPTPAAIPNALARDFGICLPEPPNRLRAIRGAAQSCL